MKYLPFKILIIFILLPPVAYVASIKALENRLQAKYQEEIEDVYLGDTARLLSGAADLAESINENIIAYRRSQRLLNWGLKLNVNVYTEAGTILYPLVHDDPDQLLEQRDPLQIAADNYRLMQEGLVVAVDLKIEHNDWLSNTLLGFFILTTVAGLSFYYRTASRKADLENLRIQSEIEQLRDLEKSRSRELERIDNERERLYEQYAKTRKALEDEKNRSSRSEEEMVEEIVMLEEEIAKTLKSQEAQLRQIEDLQEQIKKFESLRRADSKQKAKNAEAHRKRFNALYKNLVFHDRALSGFDMLEEDMKIRAEEVIHQLNQDPALVQIKRKVFGRKNREAVLEVLFGYKGRLYFRNLKDRRIEILTVGTKNTQDKDLTFLNSL